MAKILNLDVLAAKVKSRELVLNGASHEVKEMTVENFIETTRTAQRLVAEDAPVADRIEASVEMIKRSIPSLKDDVLRALPLETLSAIVSFVRGEDEDEAVQEEGAPEAGNE